MTPSKTAAWFLTVLGVACSTPAQNPEPNAGGAGNSASAGSNAAGGATSGGTSGGAAPGGGGTAGSSASTGGVGGSVAGSANVGGNPAGTGGGAGSGATGGGGDGNSGGGGGGGVGTGGTGAFGGGGATTAGASGAANGGSSTAGGGAGGRASGGAAGSGGGSGGAFGVCNGAAPPRAVSIYVVGDSTASVYASNLAPRMGWGQPLQDLFATQCAVVHDVALSGRSSKSFIDEGAWTPVRNALVSGDIVLVQFAHNDEKDDDPARYTEPQTTFKQYLTTYITDTRAKQATPYLLTPINRNSWSGATVSNSHGAYPDAMRELAASLQVPLIDMTAITKQYFERVGQAATNDIFLILSPGESPNYPSGVTDNTHFQEAGARILGRLVAYDAYRQRLALASYLKAVPTAP